MILQTKNFGELELDESKIIEFPEALPGFPQLKKFVLFHKKDENGEEMHTFVFLQSVEDGDIAFTLLDVSHYLEDYALDFHEKELDVIGGFSQATCWIYNITIVPDKLEDMRTNLKAPIIINTETKKAKQVVMNGDYDVRFHIYKSLKEK